jgi:hypothetical protein
VDTPPIKPLEQRRQFCRRQTHQAILDLRPAEDAFLESLGEQAQTRTIPEDQPPRLAANAQYYDALYDPKSELLRQSAAVQTTICL